MSKPKKSLAALLALVMLMSLLPMSVAAAPSGEVTYNLLDNEVTLDESDYGEDGSYTIELEENAYFPYEVQFQYGGETWTEWFETQEEEIEVGGHIFKVHSEGTDPYTLRTIGVKLGDEIIYAYPEEKEFTAEPQVSAFSMLPLNEVHLKMEIKNPGVVDSEIYKDQMEWLWVEWTSITDASGNKVELQGEPVVWTKWEYYDREGNYHSEKSEYSVFTDKFDLGYHEFDASDYTNFDHTCHFEFICGTADQLDENNTRYIVEFEVTGFADHMDVQMANSRNEKIDVYDVGAYWRYDSSTNTNKRVCQIMVDGDKLTDEVSLGMVFDAYYSNRGVDPTKNFCDIDVIEGYWDKFEKWADPSPHDGLIWKTYEDGKNYREVYENGLRDFYNVDEYNILVDGGYKWDFKDGPMEITLAFHRGDNERYYLPMVIEVYPASASLYVSSIHSDTLDYAYSSSRYDAYQQQTVVLRQGFKTSDNYLLTLGLYDPRVESHDGKVRKAVLGLFNEDNEEFKQAEDIKDALFKIPKRNLSTGKIEGGYEANYSNGVGFTVQDAYGKLHQLTVKVAAYESEVQLQEPAPNNPDTYLQVNGASSGDGKYISAWTMPYNADSYYYNGYQTVFLMKPESGGNYSALDSTEIIPEFWTDSRVKVFAGANNTSADEQKSGISKIDFESGKAVRYTVGVEGVPPRNYVVTYITQQTGGPKLFVNGINDESRWTEEGKPQREVFLTEEFNFYHDIFFANIGDAEMNGLHVELKNAKNIALDEYWTIKDNSKLAPFKTTAKTTSNGELPNVGKVRLVQAVGADGKTMAGEVSGTLVIGYGNNPANDIEIELSGFAGNPKIVTDNMKDGVKFVHYSQMIQTNDMYSGTMKYEITSGKLPDGLDILNTGEIYGVPTKTGTFTFTVKASFVSEKYGEFSDSKELTITILENSRDNVDAANDPDNQGYERLDAIGGDDLIVDLTQITSETDERLMMRSNGPFIEFVQLTLDGEELKEGTDYDSEEGSTKNTIRRSTLRNKGNGTYTVSAEFRNPTTKEMRRTAQLVTVTGAGSGNGNGGGNFGGGGTVVVNPSYPVTVPAATENGKVTVSPTSAKAGDTVTVTVTPDEGYQVKSITAGDAKVTSIGDNKYTFVMPKTPVKIEVEFEKKQATGLAFKDVDTGDWFYDAVKYAFDHGLMIGTSEDSFSPNTTCEQGMFVTILYRLDGEPEVSGAYTLDTSTPEDIYYRNPVIWAEENGIINDDWAFTPEEMISREQMATIIYRYAEYKKLDMTPKADLSAFTDADQISDYAADAMSWANKVGLIIGTSDTTLAPTYSATRAQMATILMRFCETFTAEQ